MLIMPIIITMSHRCDADSGRGRHCEQGTLEKWASGGEGGAPLFPHGDVLARILKTRQRKEINAKQKLSGCFLTMDIPNELATRTVLVAVKEKASTFEHLRLAGNAVKEAMAIKPR